jgi:hypothetical protein
MQGCFSFNYLTEIIFRASANTVEKRLSSEFSDKKL